MENEENKQESAVHRWGWRLAKITAFLAVFVVLMLVVLVNIGGNSDTLREPIEDYLTAVSGYKTEITTLHGMTFFPNVSVNVEGVKMFSAEGNAPVATVAKAHVAMGLTDVLFKSGKITTLYVEELNAKAGAFIKPSVHVRTAEIQPAKDESSIPQLSVKGKIDTHDLSLRIDMDQSGKGERAKYFFGKKTSFDMTLADMKAEGVFSKGWRKLKIEEFKISDSQNIFNGTLYFKDKISGRVGIEGDLFVGDSTQFTPDLAFKQNSKGLNVRGDLNVGKITPADIDRAIKFADRLVTIFSPEVDKKDAVPIELDAFDIDIDVSLGPFYEKEFDLGTVEVPVRVTSGNMMVGPFSGNISGGRVNGNVDLKTSAGDADLNININVKDIDYGRFQQAFLGNELVGGDADFVVSLTSAGKTWGALHRGLHGEIAFIAGQGRVSSKVFNVWTVGLASAILPSAAKKGEALQLNCAIADFKVENSIANASAMFVDTERLTLRGKGKYDIVADELDMTLTPKQKSITIGDVASGVDINGSLSNPSYSLNVLDLGLKIGKTLLGTVNPAFYAIGLADMGLTDKHPCYAFIEPSKKEKPAPKAEEAEKGDAVNE